MSRGMKGAVEMVAAAGAEALERQGGLCAETEAGSSRLDDWAGVAGAAGERQLAVLVLDVVNHSGVMSHVMGLFSRRAYNVEGILCLPLAAGRHSRIWLLVNEDARLPQVMRQVEKLEDVVQVYLHPAGAALFGPLQAFCLPENSEGA